MSKKMLKSGKMSPRELLDYENNRYGWFDVAICCLPFLVLFGAIFCIILDKMGWGAMTPLELWNEIFK